MLVVVLSEFLAPLVFWLGLEWFRDSGRVVMVLEGMMVVLTCGLMLWLLISLFRDSVSG